MGWIAKICSMMLRNGVWSLVALGFITGPLHLAIVGQEVAKDQSNPDTPDKDYSAELPRIPPQSVEQAITSFDVMEGFDIQLVASEPLVTDPIAFVFDAHENLFVVEMRDYSEQETERLGSIALLKDTNGDGKMDSRTTFVEGLSWPTAIWNWRDGVLVAEPPNITWYRDTDGDGKSDKSEVWFDGFQRSNVQGLVNSLRWGVDGLIHGATSSSGAEVDQLAAHSQSKLALRGRDFAIDPLSKSIRPESGGGQHGMSFDRWGNKFVTSNSDHLQQIINLDNWLSQHPSSVAIPSMRRSIAEDGPQAEVFRSSPVEPWRIVRTRLRMSGVAPGVVEGGGRAAGYFTGATGTWIMDAEAGFGLPDFDTAIVCDVGSNLVHRKQLRANGLFRTANRMDAGTELLRSSDTWFRPVQLGDGPDGALYIADMYREVIEHPKSLPPMIKKHLDLTSGRDRGRIWRLTPKIAGKAQASSRQVQALCRDDQLVDLLSSPIHWQRRMASQLIVERMAKGEAARLRELVQSGRPEARILALHCLDRMDLLDEETLLVGMRSPSAPVQAHAIALSATREPTGRLSSQLIQLASQGVEPNVQLELALASPKLSGVDRMNLLQNLMSATDPLVRAIIVTAAGNESIQLVTSDLVPTTDRRSWLDLLLPTWSKQTGAESQAAIGKAIRNGLETEAGVWLAALRNLPSPADAQRLLSWIDKATREKHLQSIDEQIVAAIADPSESRVAAIRLLGLLPSDRQQALAVKALVATSPESIQGETIESLVWSDAEASSKLLLSRFYGMTPALQRTTLNGLMSHRQSLPAIAEALEQRRILPSQIAPDVRQRLLESNDATLKKRFAKVLQSATADRVAIIDQYAAKLSVSETADEIEAGQAIFVRVCAQCHRLNDLGNDVGPPLKQLADKSPQQLLEIILDPNREVDPKYASYTVLLNDDRVFAGIIMEEAASQIVVAEAGGKRHTIARSDIDQLRSTGVSLMPVGLEQQIAPEQMNQLISYLKQAGK
jgi:putative membrane-bound dehydrogenase-like protein